MAFPSIEVAVSQFCMAALSLETSIATMAAWLPYTDYFGNNVETSRDFSCCSPLDYYLVLMLRLNSGRYSLLSTAAARTQLAIKLIS